MSKKNPVRSPVIIFLAFVSIFQLGFFWDDHYSMAEKGNLSGIQNYIAKGGDVNVKNRHGLTLLIYSARGGHPSVVTYLLKQGADPNAETIYGTTALHYAATSHYDAVIESLVHAGAKPNVFASTYKRGYSATHTALRDFPYECTPLHWAIYSRDGDLAKKEASVKTLLDAGANPNARNHQCPPPLSLAVSRANEAIAKMLIQKGSDINSDAPLHLAVLHDSYEIVNLLIKSGCDVNKEAQFSSSFLPLDEVVGEHVPLKVRTVTPIKLAKSDRVRELLRNAGAHY